MSSIDATFVRADLNLLGQIASVIPYRFRGPRDYLGLLAHLLNVDVTYCWFALGFAAFAVFLSRMLGRRALVVAGGWDVVAMHDIGYGRLLTVWGRFVARLTFLLAHEVLAFSDWSADQIRRLSHRARVRRVYLSVDSEAFHPTLKEDIVVCISNITRENLFRKGLRTFVEAASLVGNARFFLIGGCLDGSASDLQAIAPPNVTLTGRLPDPDVRFLLARAKVYCQPSYTEGFGVAIAEAMASGCVPVVTRAGAIPEVVGDTGIFVEYGSPSSLAVGIRSALKSDRGAVARARVVRMFGPERRLEELKIALGTSDVRRATRKSLSRDFGG